jgi:multiple sugar transport system substrate-binding protein
MKNLTTFQLVVLGLFVTFIIVGVGVFSAFGGLLGSSSVGPVVVWGTLDQNAVDTTLATLRSSDKSFQAVTYVQKNAGTYTQDVVNAMAAGKGPDLFVVSQDELAAFADKITPVPYAAVSQAQFTNSFIDEGTLFLTPQGALALPLTVDPLVMYWNRDIFAAAGVASPPAYWSDLITLAPKITSIDRGATLQKSAVALGQWQNITNAKAILTTLVMQAGDPLTGRDQNGAAAPEFGMTPQGAPENPAESALRFYTEFADPSKTTYSWNGSLPASQLSFVAGNVGMYFGFASELPGLLSRNPNLNFSVSPLPQLQGSSAHLTFGELEGLAIARTAPNASGALTIAQKLTGQQAVSLLSQALGLPPVRRDVALDTSNNAAMQIFVESSLIARGWLDPDPAATDGIFKAMVEDVVSGAQQPAGAVSQAAQAFAALFH